MLRLSTEIWLSSQGHETLEWGNENLVNVNKTPNTHFSIKLRLRNSNIQGTSIKWIIQYYIIRIMQKP